MIEVHYPTRLPDPFRLLDHGISEHDRETIRANEAHYLALREEIISKLRSEDLPVNDLNIYEAAQLRGWSEATAFVIASVGPALPWECSEL